MSAEKTPSPASTVDSRVADLALRLIQMPSPSGQEGGVAALVTNELRDLGLEVEVDVFGNVTGTLDAGPGPCVLLDSHMDTVGVTDRAAWSFDPDGEIAGGRLYGRGAMDMKGPLAASVCGVAALRDRLTSGRVVVCASVAEELVEGPMAAAVARRVKPDAVIVCEATSLRLSLGQRGRAEVVIDVAGKPTHSSRPDLGINAAEAMADIIRAIRTLKLPTGPAHLSPAILVLTDIISRPYPGLSVVPDRCRATYDRRTLPGESEADVLTPITAAIDQALAAHDGASATASIARDQFSTYTGRQVDEPNFAPAWSTDADSPLARTATEALRTAGLSTDPTAWDFCTNGSGTAGLLGIPTIGFGPGDEALAHRVDEHIEIAHLEVGVRAYTAITHALVGSARGVIQ